MNMKCKLGESRYFRNLIQVSILKVPWPSVLTDSWDLQMRNSGVLQMRNSGVLKVGWKVPYAELRTRLPSSL